MFDLLTSFDIIVVHSKEILLISETMLQPESFLALKKVFHDKHLYHISYVDHAWVSSQDSDCWFISQQTNSWRKGTIISVGSKSFILTKHTMDEWICLVCHIRIDFGQLCTLSVGISNIQWGHLSSYIYKCLFKHVFYAISEKSTEPKALQFCASNSIIL